MDKSSLGQTVAVMNFQRQYMKRVFVSEELKAYENFKKAAKRIKKQRNESSTQKSIQPYVDPLEQLNEFKRKR